jgi:SAM-dependent MidA family methyltransferase
MPGAAHARIVDRIRSRGPITAAEFMEIALYDPEHGYYGSAAQRSGRGGDFFTSVDVGPLFGEMLAVQLAEMCRALDEPVFDVVEAAAGNGRLSRDVLDTLAREAPDVYAAARLTLVEASAAARDAQPATLGPHAPKLQASLADLPSTARGVIFANELLDALPTHVVTMTNAGLREILVAERDGALVEIVGDLSTPEIAAYLSRAGARLQIGARCEVNLDAIRWIETAAAVLTRGFLLLIDYGHPADELYSPTHASGTLTTYRRHKADAAHWLDRPGSADLTSHVDLTSVRRAAEDAGLRTLGVIDQTYFLTSLGLAERLRTEDDLAAVTRRLAAKTLVMPGGLGSTMKVLGFTRDAEHTALRGFSSGRLT